MRVATLGAAGAIGIAYFLAARLGLVLLSKPSDVAVFWPASGVAAGILIIADRRARLPLVIGVVAGTVAANVMSDRSLLTSLLKGFCNAGEAALAAWLLERWFARPFRFANLRRVAGFLTATVLAAAASATGGAATMTLLHTAAPYWDVWRVWFLASWVGIVVVAPLVIGLRELCREPPSLREWTEGIGALTLTALVSWYTVSHGSGSWISFSPGVLVLPLLLWLTARCQPAFGSAGAAIAAGAVIFATTFGVGRFGDMAVPLLERVRGAQAAVMTVTLFTLILVAMFAQRRETEKELRESEGQLAKKSAALARLHEVGLRLWRTRDLRQALSEILAGAIELLGADMGTIRILDTQRGVLKVEAHRGFTQKALDFFDEVPVASDSLCGRVLRAGEQVVVADVEADPLFIAFRPFARAAGYRAMQSTPITNRNGMPLGILATHFRSAHKPTEQDLRLLDVYVRQAADIVERHRAEDALRESEEWLRLAQLRTGIGIWDRNLRTGRVMWTQELEAMFGLKSGTVNCYSDFRKRAHPDDIEAYEAQRDAAVLERRPFNAECRIIRTNGQVRWMSVAGGAVYDETTGEPIRVLGNFADITERKEAENALAERNLQLALAGMVGRVASYAYDVCAEKMQVSEGYALLHGLPQGTTETTLSEWRARVHPKDLGRVEAVQRQIVSEQRHEYSVEYRIVRSGGEVRWIERRGLISYDGDARPQRAVGVIIDITERKQAEDARRLLNAELDHRVKNALATVNAVVSHTGPGSGSVANFVAALNGRIRSMATTHELLSSRRWQGISLTELVRRELAPFSAHNNTEISGPDVIVRPETGQAVAMVLHELVTNAAKYGALSTKYGRVVVRWDRRLNGREGSPLVLEWREVGGPPVVATGKPGYGTSTIRDLIPYEFGGSVDLVLAPEGVRCRLELPADWLCNGDEPASPAITHANVGQDTNVLKQALGRDAKPYSKATRGRRPDAVASGMIDNYTRLRARAHKARSVDKKISNPGTNRTLLEIADEFDRLAAFETRASKAPNPEISSDYVENALRAVNFHIDNGERRLL